MKPGDTVIVHVYETLHYETTYVLDENDVDANGDVDTTEIEEMLLAGGIDWNACDVQSREIVVYPCN